MLTHRVQQLLVEQDLIDLASLERVRSLQQTSKLRFEEALEEVGGVPREVLRAFLGEYLGIPMVPLSVDHIDSEAVALLPEKVARMYGVVPILKAAGHLVVAMADPLDLFKLDGLSSVTGLPIDAVYAPAENVESALAAIYLREAVKPEAASPRREQVSEASSSSSRAAPPSGSAVRRAAGEAVAPAAQPVVVEVEAPIIRLVNLVLHQALESRASDIHVEPGKDGTRIRFRVDGILSTAHRIGTEASFPFMSRLKILASLDISERRIPQDGNITLEIAGREVDLRVATTPTVYGEGAVIRILDQSKGLIGLEAMGLARREMEILSGQAEASQGFVLVTGPTGSGKTTTLYGLLNKVDRATRKVITLEDPVEYRLAGATQIPINNRIGVTFAKALRSVLRQDPDVVLVGEIRDPETAQIAVQAAVTGHLLFSTLHTTGSVETVLRLVDLGVPLFQVREVVRCVIAQRLVRRLCMGCRVQEAPDESTKGMLRLGAGGNESRALYRPRGCSRCRGTGYEGRTAIYEILELNDAVRSALSGEVRMETLKSHARASGWRTLWENAVDRVLDGTTTADEIARCIPRS